MVSSGFDKSQRHEVSYVASRYTHVKVSLVEEVAAGIRGGRIGLIGTRVAKDSRVEAAVV